MTFNAAKYQNQIRAILQAPGVDLSTISAKRVRKQLLEQNDDLTPELVKEHKDELDGLIGNVYEQVSADLGGEDGDVPMAEENGKRKREDVDMSPQASPSSAPKRSKKAPKTEAMTDEELARQLANELNGRDRPTRAAAAKPNKVAKPRRKKAKSAATIDSDAEDASDEKPKKRRGGFTKEYTLRCANVLFSTQHSLTFSLQ